MKHNEDEVTILKARIAELEHNLQAVKTTKLNIPSTVTEGFNSGTSPLYFKVKRKKDI